MPWAVVIIAVFVAGFVEFWRLCRMAPVMIDEGQITRGCDVGASDYSPEQRYAADARADPILGARPGSETLVAHLTAALEVAGNAAPYCFWKPVEARNHHEAGHQPQEQVGCGIQH